MKIIVGILSLVFIVIIATLIFYQQYIIAGIITIICMIIATLTGTRKRKF